MAKQRDFRIQTTIPAAPVADGSPNKVALYADPSGIILNINQVGTVSTVGQSWTGHGRMFGSPVTGALGTGLAQWLPVYGASGILLLIPAYLPVP
jgi:hypothetical protein